MSDGFDQLTKQIGQATSRRGALRALGAGLLGILFGAATSKNAVAADPATSLRCRSECQTKCSAKDLKTGRVRMDFICYRECVPTCETCGTCKVCDLSTQACTPCGSTCEASGLKLTAEQDPAYRLISSYLMSQGYVNPSQLNAFVATDAGVVQGNVVETRWTNSISINFAAHLHFVTLPSGLRLSSAFLLKDNHQTRLITVNAEGQIEDTPRPLVLNPPIDATTNRSPAASGAAGPAQAQDCSCPYWCNLAGALGCGALGALACAPLGPGSPAHIVCTFALGEALCEAKGGSAICAGLCAQYICDCTATNVQCGWLCCPEGFRCVGGVGGVGGVCVRNCTGVRCPACSRCDDATGNCVSNCGKCATCISGACESKKCPDCFECDPGTGNCVRPPGVCCPPNTSACRSPLGPGGHLCCPDASTTCCPGVGCMTKLAQCCSVAGTPYTCSKTHTCCKGACFPPGLPCR